MDRHSPDHDQPGFETERADSMMRQRMARAAQQQQQQQHQGGHQQQQMPQVSPAGPYQQMQLQQKQMMQQQQQHGTMAPNGASPSMAMPRPGPIPQTHANTGAITALTGSGRRISPAIDPLQRKNEKATGAPMSQPDLLVGVNQLLFGVVTAIGFSAVFVLPRQLQVFWVLIVGLTLLMYIGLHLYKEMMHLGNNGGEDSVKQAEYAWMLLFLLMGVYTAVMVGILVFMSWSLYGISNARSNVIKNDVKSEKAHGRNEGHSRHHKRYRV